MNIVFHEDQDFEGLDFTGKKPDRREFADCRFTNCDFSKSFLGNDDFMDCSFRNCNFSLAILENTGLKQVEFADCKMVGIDFSKCNNFNFSVSFNHCPLDYSSFFRKKMKKTGFKDCSLKEADFTETDLTMAVFNDCDLLNATFIQSILEKTDFRTARNYALDPENNHIKRARFSFPAVAGLLTKYNIEIE